MKISKLNIESYRHLQNLDFDFTYQTGERKGQPLDKICFIGQSATGKTGLLELIYEHISHILNNEFKKSFFLENSKLFNGKIDILVNKKTLSSKNNEIYYDNEKYEFNDSKKSVTDLITRVKNGNAFYFQASLISNQNIEIFTLNPIDLLEKYRYEILDIRKDFKSNGIKFNEDINPNIWLFLLNDILHYRKNFTQIMTELVHKGYIADAKKFRTEYEKWQKTNPNALDFFAEKLNPILEKLNLEVDLVNTEYSIPIKNKRTDEIIPIQNTSTGTKGLLLSFLPLFKLDTKDSIIIIDEPERSLYPDMQMDLMDHYKKLARDAQFIVATHSPFIAASFEAEERFILYFDEEGKVAVRRGSSPIGDDPNDMLKNDFGVNYYNKYGEEAYQKYLHLKEKIANESDPKKKKELLLETVKLGDTYNF